MQHNGPELKQAPRTLEPPTMTKKNAFFAAQTQAQHNLPHARQEIFMLLAMLSIIVGHLSFLLPVWAGVFAIALLLWRAVIAWKNTALPQPFTLGGVLLVGLIGCAIEAFQGPITGAALILLMLLIPLKTLEMRRQRDLFAVFFLGFFGIIANFLFIQSISVAVLMLVAFLGLVTSVIHAQMPPNTAKRLKKSAQIALQLLMWSLPLIVVLYLFFPRFAPLWAIPNTQKSAKTGLSDSMDVGSMAQLAQDPSIALRVRFLSGTAPAQNQLYFRGPVLSKVVGNQWLSEPSSPANFKAPVGGASNPIESKGSTFEYEVLLEANNEHWLTALDGTNLSIEMDERTYMQQNAVWQTAREIRSTKRYRARSTEEFSNAQNIQESHQSRYLQPFLQLPENSNPRTRAWAQDLRQQFLNANTSLAEEEPIHTRNLIDFVLAHLRSQGYRYTLEPGVYGTHAADEFWFDRKAGFCEHIASAFAIAMRAAGIPARIVTGYQGGEANFIDPNVLTVRQSDAHAWTEVWIKGTGWLRVDPTAAIAPERISLSRTQGMEQGGTAASGRTEMGSSWLWSMRSALEAIDYRWMQWVVNYNRQEQTSLMEKLGLQRLTWGQILLLAIALLCLTALSYAVWSRHKSKDKRDPWLRLLHEAQQTLTSKGIQITDTDPPLTMAQKTQSVWGDSAAPIAQWLVQMDAFRYAAPSPNSKAELKVLSDRWKKMQWPSSQASN